MTTTPDLGLPELAQAQANPHATFNEDLALIQAVAMNGVLDKDLTAPPGSPVEGDAYLLNTATPTGAWAGHAYCVAVYVGNAWRFVPGNNDVGTPITMGARQAGMRVYVRDERASYFWIDTPGSPGTYAWRKTQLSAADVANVPAGNIAATNVQDAINELDNEKVAKAGDTMTGALSIVLPAAGTGFTVQNNDPGITGAIMALYHNSASPAVSDVVGAIQFRGNSLAPANLFLGQVSGRYVATTLGAESLEVYFRSRFAGALNDTFAVGAGGRFGAPTGGDMGLGTVNAVDYYDDGVNISGLYVAKAGDVMAGLLTLNRTGGSLPTAIGDEVLRMSQNGVTRLHMEAAAQANVITGRRSNNVLAAPSALLANDLILGIQGRGFDSSVWSGNQAFINFNASQNWNAAARGTFMAFATTPNGSITSATRWTIENTGGLFAAGATGGDQGANTINASEFYDDGVALTAKYAQLAGGNTFTGSSNIFSYNATTIFDRLGGGSSLFELRQGGVTRGFVGADATYCYINYSSGGAAQFSVGNSTGVVVGAATGAGQGVGTVNATRYYRNGIALNSAAAVATDADFTVIVGTNANHIRHTGTLTANRTVTLSTTGVVDGDEFEFTRTGAGGFNLSIGGLKNLATNTWCRVKVVGGAWTLSAYGAL